MLSISSQLVGLVATVVQDSAAGAGKLETGARVAQNGTQYNYLNHDDGKDFVSSMKECGNDENCQRKAWDAGFAQLSQANFDEAMATGGAAWAKDQMLQITGGLAALEGLTCVTATCEQYKFTLIDRALTSYARLADVVGEWEPILGAIGGVAAGVAGTRPTSNGTRPPGSTPTVGSAQVEKAYAYWSKVKAEGGVFGKGTAAVIDSAPLAQRVMDVRAGLPSYLRRSGNVAVAEIDIQGLPKQMAAHSQVSEAGKGLIGSGSGNFTAQTVPNKAGDMVYRGIDTEYKILDNIADKLGSNTSARETVNILTEKPACASCLNVAEQFKAKYPNITVNIFDNQGGMLRPPRKTP
ncbi:deaminase domain-containing protein [Pseudomonas panipatensis]|uniref:deaminase domain-containing protein n=1 Tax=Pseudomonas panipatensis TaxID=428992 RepID=UPI001BB0A9BE|nr:deaminase domain-containing protein [Pseudomonas panipatensis]